MNDPTTFERHPTLLSLCSPAAEALIDDVPDDCTPEETAAIEAVLRDRFQQIWPDEPVPPDLRARAARVWRWVMGESGER